MILLYVFPLIMGASIASQSAVNSRLKKYTGSPFLSSAISFFVGLLFLSSLLLVMKQSPFIVSSETSSLPWWAWIGGFTAAFALTVNVLIFPILGSVQTSVLPIAGQLMMGTIIDQVGLFSSPQSSLSIKKVIGLVILTVGMFLATEVIDMSKKNNAQKKKKEASKVFWQLLGIFAGILIAIQSATNGYLGHKLGSPLRATFFSFGIAFLTMSLISYLSKTKLKSAINAFQTVKKEKWIFVGGILGSFYVLLSAWLVPIIGTGSVIVIALFGQLMASTVIQQLGLFHSEIKKIKTTQIIGLVMMLVGIIIIRLF